jgi:hypothetical protein
MRTNIVEVRAMIFEFPICAVVRLRSDLIASGMRGGNANQDKNATKNPTLIKAEENENVG